jgi:hypothetical protein
METVCRNEALRIYNAKPFSENAQAGKIVLNKCGQNGSKSHFFYSLLHCLSHSFILLSLVLLSTFLFVLFHLVSLFHSLLHFFLCLFLPSFYRCSIRTKNTNEVFINLEKQYLDEICGFYFHFVESQWLPHCRPP